MKLVCPDCGAEANRVGGFDVYEIYYYSVFDSEQELVNPDTIKFEISCPECSFLESYYSIDEMMRHWEDEG